MNQFTAKIRKIPPVTRFLCFSSLCVTIPVLIQLVHPDKIIFIRQLVTRRLEIWRIFTSFFLGSGDINYVFELAMLYRTANQLESGPFSEKPAAFARQLIFVGASIILVCLPLGAAVFTRPLLIALTHLSSALAPATVQTPKDLLTLPVKFVPYIMIGMNFLIAGPAGAVQGIAGVVVGYLWRLTMWPSQSIGPIQPPPARSKLSVAGRMWAVER